jgi:putative two-component system response regulator
MSHADAAAIIAGGRGSHFDPDVVDAFVALSDEFQSIRSKFQDSHTSPTTGE